MKIVIDLYDLGFKLHDLTEDEILQAVGRQPQYRDRVWAWKKTPNEDITCSVCAMMDACRMDKVEGLAIYCSTKEHNKNLQPYFKRR